MKSNKATPIVIAADASGIQAETLRGRMRRGKTLEEAVAMGQPSDHFSRIARKPRADRKFADAYSDRPMGAPPPWTADPSLLPKAPPVRRAS